MDEALIAFLRAQLAVMGADAHRKHDVGLCQVSQATYYANVPCTCGEPARVLAEVDAQRQIIDHIVDSVHGWDADADEAPTSRADADCAISDLQYVLKMLALPGAGHTDYREEWKP